MRFYRRCQSVLLMLIFCCISPVYSTEISFLESWGKPPTFVGTEICGQCHQAQLRLWQGSHHDLSMQPATSKSVLGDFNDQSFSYYGVTSNLYRKSGGFFIRTDGPDGKLTEYQIKYALGYYPLQQYIVEFPDGRLQVLGVAWDSRSKADGGERWFHVYKKENVKAGEKIHWTGIDQNWNHMCSECHSTNVHKNYDVATNQFATTWSEINVACESCHGQGSAHVDWARLPPIIRSSDDRLLIKLTSRNRPHWQRPSEANVAHTDKPGIRLVTDLCSRCHSRRSELSERYEYGKPLLNTHEPELLTAGKYYPDGRMQDEVFNYGSFLQSKMYQAGVSCNDCHEPHSLKLREEGNAVCTQCHKSDTYDSERHHFHKAQTKGSLCSECHMSTTTYMGVDRRHDHGFRIPRPDLTERFGIPNACNDCHVKESPSWAQAIVTKHFGTSPGGFQNYAATLQEARTGSAKAWPALGELAASPSVPAIARGTALWEMRNYLSASSVPILQSALNDPEPLVRLGAVKTLVEGPDHLKPLLLKVIDDPQLSIRTLAGSGLATIPMSEIPTPQHESLRRAQGEYIEAQRLNGDRPESQMNLGVLYGDLGKYPEAEGAYKRAIMLEPGFTQAYINLVELLRLQSRDTEGEKILRGAIYHFPQKPELHHELGLLLVRAEKLRDALPELKKASHLDQKNAHYGYVYAVALQSSGASDKAMQVLGDLDRAQPNNVEVLTALAVYNRASGHFEKAIYYAERLKTLMPDDEAIARLVANIKAQSQQRH